MMKIGGNTAHTAHMGVVKKWGRGRKSRVKDAQSKRQTSKK